MPIDAAQGARGAGHIGPGRVVDAVALAVLVTVVGFCALSPIWEMDAFWHVAVGREILAQRGLPAANVWSAADPTQAYSPFQWLWDAGAAGLDAAGGLQAVRVANAVWIVLTFVLLYVGVRRHGAAPLVALVIGLLVLAAFHDRIRVRPHVANFTAELLLVGLVARRAAPTPRTLAAVFLGFALWGCLHAGGAWMGVVGLVGAALVVMLADRARADEPSRAERRAWLLVVLAAAIGFLLAPGSRAALASIETSANAYVDEWKAWPGWPPQVSAGTILHVLLTRAFQPLVALAWLVVARRAWRRWRAGEALRQAGGLELLLAVYFLALAFWGMRFAYMASLAGLLVLAAHRRLGAGAAATPATPATGRPRRRAALVLAALGLSAVPLHYETVYYPDAWTAVQARAMPVDERYFPGPLVDLLVRARVEARVATTPNFGGYILYHGYPRLTVTIDGRFIAPPEVLEISRAIVDVREGKADPALLPGLYAMLPAELFLMPRPAFFRPPPDDFMLVASTPVAELWTMRSRLRPEVAEALRAAARAGQ